MLNCFAQVPVLVIGTKVSRAKGQLRRNLHIADLCGAEQIFVDSTGDGEHNSGLAPGSSNAVKLSRFFDKVVTNHSEFSIIITLKNTNYIYIYMYIFKTYSIPNLHQVIEKRYYNSKNVMSPQTQSLFGDRRRPANSPRCLHHLD